MQAQTPYAADPAQVAMLQKKLALENRARAGIGWFFWIAGLSLVNTLTFLFGASFTFVIGLGITQIVDGVIAGVIKGLGSGWDILRLFGLLIDVLIAGAFVLIGYVGRKGYRWPVIVGMVLYALDGIVLLLFQDWFGAAFHAWALFGIWNGLQAMRQLQALGKPSNTAPEGSLARLVQTQQIMEDRRREDQMRQRLP